jgi:ABC-2 type transport system ATP-binding protein
VARIKNVAPEKRAQSVESAMEMTKIADKRDELIKRLSRGYKQRVGLAQAIVHDPDVIILDEPTVGLDPKQIIEVRHLIKGLAGNHTIILSTHILPEVSMTCDRVIIINNGKIVAVDTPENLTRQLKGGERIRVEAQAPEQQLRDALQKIPGAQKVQVESLGSGGRMIALVEAGQGADLRSQIAAKIVGQGWPLYELRGESVSLEEIFLQLTTEDPAHKQTEKAEEAN